MEFRTAAFEEHRKARITVRVRLFARYAELLGRDEWIVEVATPATVHDAIQQLRAQAPDGHLLPERPLVAAHLRHVLPDDPVADGEELAVLPPLAGG